MSRLQKHGWKAPMKLRDRVEFARIVTGLSAIKPGNKLTPEGLELYWMALQNWELEDFKRAAAHLASTCEFMPNPYHFEQLRKAGRPTAGEAFARAVKASGSAIQCGYVTNNGACGDELIDRVVRAIGGYGVLAMCETDKLTFLERRFTEHYESISDAQETRDALPQITQDHRQQLSGPQSIAALLLEKVTP